MYFPLNMVILLNGFNFSWMLWYILDLRIRRGFQRLLGSVNNTSVWNTHNKHKAQRPIVHVLNRIRGCWESKKGTFVFVSLEYKVWHHRCRCSPVPTPLPWTGPATYNGMQNPLRQQFSWLILCLPEELTTHPQSRETLRPASAVKLSAVKWVEVQPGLLQWLVP